MARRKNKKVARRRTSRRSVGAVGADMAQEILAVTAGAVIAGKVISLVGSKLDAKIAAVVPIAVGVFLPKFVKNSMVKGISNGMIAVGGQKLVSNFLPALGQTDDVVLVSGLDEIGALDQIGYGSEISEINGTDINEINGYDEY
jgi:hypothetical protein